MLTYKAADVSGFLNFTEVRYTSTFLTFIAYCQRQNC